jgi:hypothetical protein
MPAYFTQLYLSRLCISRLFNRDGQPLSMEHFESVYALYLTLTILVL